MKNIIKTSYVLILVSVFTLGTAKGQKSGDGIDFFHGTWAQALKKSKESGKPIFVDAYTVWCGPCKWMNANVFPKKSIGDYYNKNFINMKIDMEKGEGIKIGQTYKVMAYPTLLYIDGNGKVLKRAMGMHNVEQFLQLGKSVPVGGKS